MANDSANKVNTIKADTKDTIDEAKQRAEAAAEKLKRGVEGDAMPVGERVASHVKEALHKTAAEIDAAKRDVRHEATNADDKV
jgi:hypothetical protein